MNDRIDGHVESQMEIYLHVYHVNNEKEQMIMGEQSDGGCGWGKRWDGVFHRGGNNLLQGLFVACFFFVVVFFNTLVSAHLRACERDDLNNKGCVGGR